MPIKCIGNGAGGGAFGGGGTASTAIRITKCATIKAAVIKLRFMRRIILTIQHKNGPRERNLGPLRYRAEEGTRGRKGLESIA